MVMLVYQRVSHPFLWIPLAAKVREIRKLMASSKGMVGFNVPKTMPATARARHVLGVQPADLLLQRLLKKRREIKTKKERAPMV